MNRVAEKLIKIKHKNIMIKACDNIRVCNILP